MQFTLIMHLILIGSISSRVVVQVQQGDEEEMYVGAEYIDSLIDSVQQIWMDQVEPIFIEDFSDEIDDFETQRVDYVVLFSPLLLVAIACLYHSLKSQTLKNHNKHNKV